MMRSCRRWALRRRRLRRSEAVHRQFLLLSGELADQIHLRLAVGRSVRMQDLVKPYGRLAENVRMLPGFPRQIRLRLAGDESPVDGSDAFLLGDWQNCVKRAACRT